MSLVQFPTDVSDVLQTCLEAAQSTLEKHFSSDTKMPLLVSQVSCISSPYEPFFDSPIS